MSSPKMNNTVCSFTTVTDTKTVYSKETSHCVLREDDKSVQQYESSSPLPPNNYAGSFNKAKLQLLRTYATNVETVS
jgi:hypothetical protein